MSRENHPIRRPDPLVQAANVFGDRWTLLILREAFYGVRRYGDMARNLGIARNVLAARLRTMVADGLLERRRYRTDPDWYEYVLTDAGLNLYGAIVAILRWASVHLPGRGDDLLLRHRLCGELTHAKVVCAECGEELHARDVEVENRGEDQVVT